MDDEIDRLRSENRRLEAENARLRERNPSHVRFPEPGQSTSCADIDLLFTAAEKTRMPQIVTDPNLPDNPIVFANRAFQELSGYSSEELVGRNCRFLQGPATDRAEIAKVRDAIAARRDVVVEILNYRRDGSTFHNELYVSPVFTPEGHLRYFFASQLDVTRFRSEEGKLAESEARYRTLFNALDAGFCVIELRFDAEGRAVDYRFVEANPAFSRHTGLDDVVGKWVSALIPDLERSWFDTYGAVALSGRPVRFESGGGGHGTLVRGPGPAHRRPGAASRRPPVQRRHRPAEGPRASYGTRRASGPRNATWSGGPVGTFSWSAVSTASIVR